MKRLALLAVAVAALAGCGTTVDTAPTALPGQVGDAGLSAVPGGSTVTADGTAPAAIAGTGQLPTSAGSVAGGSAVSSRVGAAGSSSGAAAPAVPGSARQGPIKVGFIVADFTKTAAAFGFGAVSDPQRYFQYLVKYYNAHGGFAGRQISPVYASVDGASSDYQTASQAACAQVTQDNHVELVMSNLWVNAALTSCLLKAGVPQIEGTQEVLNDSHMLAESPNLFVPSGLSTDHEATALITESVRMGWLTSKDKLGVLYDSCPYSTRAVNEAVLPLGKKYGIPLDPIEAFDCGGGFADVGKFSTGVQNAELKMHTDGVTKVMFLTQGENGSLVFFSNDAESQHWYPTYLVSSNSMMMSTKDQGEMQQDQMANVRGVGWNPTLDTDNAPMTPQMRQCRKATVAGGGQVPTSVNDTLAMYASCNAVAMGAAALEASGGVGGLTALRTGIERLGTSFVSVTSLGARTRFGPGRHDGAAAVAPFSYQAGCKCFRYVSGPRAAP